MAILKRKAESVLLAPLSLIKPAWGINFGGEYHDYSHQSIWKPLAVSRMVDQFNPRQVSFSLKCRQKFGHFAGLNKPVLEQPVVEVERPFPPESTGFVRVQSNFGFWNNFAPVLSSICHFAVLSFIVLVVLLFADRI